MAQHFNSVDFDRDHYVYGDFDRGGNLVRHRVLTIRESNEEFEPAPVVEANDGRFANVKANNLGPDSPAYGDKRNVPGKRGRPFGAKTRKRTVHEAFATGTVGTL